MAGGVGARFWPLSKNSKPKQFIDILGTGKTLIRHTFERFSSICPTENFYVVTNAVYKDLVLEQIPELNEEQVLLEPFRRNTAPCIAYANHKILKKNPNASIVVTPADHLILNEIHFVEVIKKGIGLVSTEDKLLTLGMKPQRPETGYGYIQVNHKINRNDDAEIYSVKTFTEKPHFDLAKVFYQSGEFFWNSGIFLWSLKTIRKAFKEFLPDIESLFESISSQIDTKNEQKAINQIFTKCQNISIDYGILEKSENVYVYCTEFGWSDLGSWGSMYEHASKDEHKNAVQGKNIMTYETKNCLIKAPDEKLMVVQGLKDYIVVDTENALLICNKHDEQSIRKFVDDVTARKGEKYI